jgi:hypothetical protein
MGNRLDLLSAPDWLLQPGDGIVVAMVEQIRHVPTFRRIFGDSIESYMRQDFGVRELPALRCWALNGRKESETAYYGGDIRVDVILPPSIRRQELQAFPNLLTSALIAQFRRQSFFEAVRATCPALNRLGWTFGHDNTAGFIPKDSDELCPLVMVTIDYRVNLDEWDRYAESDDRTRDEPFERTLGDLERMAILLQAVLDDGTDAPLPPDRFNVKT